MSRSLSTSEVARMLGLSEARIRELVRSGLCRPARRGRRYAFSFQDLVVLYAARGLIQQQVPAARVRRALAALSEQLPEDRPLSGLRIFADGRDVAVRDGDTAWQPETGQIVLDFSVDTVSELAAAPRLAGSAEAAGGAQAELERALELEDEDPKAAREAYQRALRIDPGLVDALVNLGRLAHEAGDLADAIELYERALERSPEDPVVHFNLALATEDARGPRAAIAHYERALALDPDFADAHFNLAGVCEQAGEREQALRHYSAYRRLTQ